MSLIQFAIRQSFVMCGSGAAAQAPSLLNSMGAKRCVLFTDHVLLHLGLANRLASCFQSSGDMTQLVGIFSDVEPDAKCSCINKGLAYFNEVAGDSILVLGGGSVIDTAKTILWLKEKGIDDVYQMIDNGIVSEFFPTAKRFRMPKIFIPTTAGTGSEVSTTAVIFDERTGIKSALMHQYLGADCALLDPDYTVSLPPKPTADSGFDALCHGMEAFFSKKANEVADSHAIAGMKKVIEYLPVAVKSGDNLQAREMMLIGECLAISAFGQTFGGCPMHNIAHALGAKYHIAHGDALAVVTPAVMRCMPEWYLPRIGEFADIIGVPRDASAQKCFDRVLHYLDEFREECGLRTYFADLKVSDADLKDIIRLVYADCCDTFYHLPEQIIGHIVALVAARV
ncbi:MAG: iron-containing alcohol dehydrogenase [Oscillospiraceae bacterium]